MLLRICALSLSIFCALTAADPASKPEQPAQPRAARFPAGMVAVFAGPSCPDGWVEEPLTKGRIPVGATTTAEAGTALGDPLEGDQPRPHDHGFTATHQLNGSPMPLRHECCFKRVWVRPQRIEFEGRTDARDASLPLFAVRMCRQERK